MHVGDLACAFVDVDSVLSLLSESLEVEELDLSLTGDCNLAHVIVDLHGLNRVHKRPQLIQGASEAVGAQRYEQALTCLEAHEEALLVIPFEARQLTIRLIKLDRAVCLGLWVEVVDLGTANDAAHDLVVFILHRAPSDVAGLSLANVAVEWRVTKRVRNSQHLVGRARN